MTAGPEQREGRPAPSVPADGGPSGMSPLLRGLLILGLALAGAVLAIYGAFLVPLRVGGAPAPVSPVLAVVGNLVLCLGGARAEGSRWGALAGAAGWAATALTLSAARPEGDVIVTGGTTGTLFLLLGMLAAAVGVGIGPPGAGGGRR